MKNPACVAISDIHFNLQTLPVASAALVAAKQAANRLKVPLVIAGDLNDTKAIIRAEVANALIAILETAKTPVYILEGNHDKVNEKGDAHGLNYLRPYATIVDSASRLELGSLKVTLVPYQNSVDKLRDILVNVRTKVIIMHQGVMGAQMGDYVVDNTSIDPKELKDFTVYSGHYHRHQCLGTVTYLGSPYTITFGEANDGPKGFLIISSDGSFEREILNLRAHRIFERGVSELENGLYGQFNEGDLLWLKVKGPKSELAKLNKNEVGLRLFGHSNFKLDKIYTEADTADIRQLSATHPPDLMDGVIDSTDESVETKGDLKKLWREIAP